MFKHWNSSRRITLFRCQREDTLERRLNSKLKYWRKKTERRKGRQIKRRQRGRKEAGLPGTERKRERLPDMFYRKKRRCRVNRA
jgi:hypothetical protein